MITFYRTPNCPRCSQIQGALEDLVIAHRVVVVRDRSEIAGLLPEGAKLPVLVDNDEVIQGSGAILRHLEELEKFKELWDKFQSDACHCDEEGNIE